MNQPMWYQLMIHRECTIQSNILKRIKTHFSPAGYPTCMAAPRYSSWWVSWYPVEPFLSSMCSKHSSLTLHSTASLMRWSANTSVKHLFQMKDFKGLPMQYFFDELTWHFQKIKHSQFKNYKGSIEKHLNEKTHQTSNVERVAPTGSEKQKFPLIIPLDQCSKLYHVCNCLQR